jgi:hypothetical protein
MGPQNRSMAIARHAPCFLAGAATAHLTANGGARNVNSI